MTSELRDDLEQLRDAYRDLASSGRQVPADLVAEQLTNLLEPPARHADAQMPLWVPAASRTERQQVSGTVLGVLQPRETISELSDHPN